MSAFYRICIFGSLAVLLLMPESAAAQGDWEIDANLFRFSFLVGEEEPGVNWSNLFDDGIGGALEAGFRKFYPGVFVLGVGFDKFAGKSVTNFSGASGNFSDLNLFTFYAGGRFYVSDAIRHRHRQSPVAFYVRTDAGASYIESVDFNSDFGSFALGPDVSDFMFDVGAGLDVKLADRTVLFLEAKYENFGAPGGSGNRVQAFPLGFGLRQIF